MFLNRCARVTCAPQSDTAELRLIENHDQDRLAGRAATVKPSDVCKQVFLSWSNDTFNNGVERAYAGITRESPIPDEYAAWVKARAWCLWPQ